MHQVAKNYITILQHNTTSWTKNSSSHYNIYRAHDPDILLLNETGIKNEAPLHIFQYTCYKTNHANERNDGAIVAVKNSLKHKLLKIDSNNFICIRIETSFGPINVATTYLPPRRNDFPYIELLNLINRQEPTYIIGDFNANHPMFGNQTTNVKGLALVRMINSGVLQWHGPPFKTWFGNRCSTPDIILSNNKTVHNMHIERGNPTINDHIPVIVNISTNPIAIPVAPRRHTAKTDWIRYKEKLSGYEPRNLKEASMIEIDEEISRVTKLIESAIEASTPLTQYRVLPAPRLTHDIKVLQIQYSELLQHASRYNSNFPREIQLEITDVRSQLREKMKHYTANLWDTLLSKIKINDPKDFWQQINYLLGNDTKKATYIMSREGKKLESDKDIAHEFRNILAEIFSDDYGCGDFDEHFREEVELYVRQEHENRLKIYDKASDLRHDNFLLKKITFKELEKCITKMRNRAPGATGIMQVHLKEAPYKVIQGYCNLFNACITIGYFPKSFKTATIKMIPKPGKINTLSINYRPISLLEVPGKVFEKIINKRLIEYWTEHGKINEQQFGFRPHRGTLHAIALATEKLAINLSVKSRTSLVLRDVSKAFDRVWHDGLRFKILNSNVPKCMATQLSEFLQDRKAYVMHGNSKSSVFSLKTGVAQGGCISPTLYIFYCSDIPPPIYYKNEDILFADDITQIITTPGHSQKMHAIQIKKEVERINNYEKKWRIITNQTKFKIIPVNNQIASRAELNIGGKRQNYDRSGSFLGLEISNYGYTKHVDNIVNRAKIQLAKLKRFKQLSQQIKKRLYTTLIRPILEYPAAPMHALTWNNIKKIQTVQNKATRFITNTYYPTVISAENLHTMCNLVPMNVVLHERACAIWRNIGTQNYDMLLRLNQSEKGTLIHKQFPFSADVLEKNFPEPKYV